MKYPYAVKFNGVNYPAGAEVPVGVSAPKKEEEKPVVKEEAEIEQKPKVFPKKKTVKK